MYYNSDEMIQKVANKDIWLTNDSVKPPTLTVKPSNTEYL